MGRSSRRGEKIRKVWLIGKIYKNEKKKRYLIFFCRLFDFLPIPIKIGYKR